MQLLSPYPETVKLSKFTSTVAEIMDIDLGDHPEVGYDLMNQLSWELPGMFGERDTVDIMRDTLNDYYYNRLTPDEQRSVREFFGVERFDIPDEPGEISRMFSALLSLYARHDMLGEGMLITQESNTLPVPPLNEVLDEQELADLDQLRIDFHRYVTARESGVLGTWTDLMTKYYSDENSAKGKFWGAMVGISLSGAAFDDPIIGPFMSRAARDTIEFTDEQYDVATEYLIENLDKLTDPEATQIIRDHPDWYDQAQQERMEFDKFKRYDMEIAKSQYYAIYWKDRAQWEQENAEEWTALESYMDRERARALNYPYYAFFFKKYDWGRWYGVNTTPDVVEAGQAKEKPSLSEEYDQALQEMEAWINGSGEWTDLMLHFFGPEPEIVREAE